MQEAAPRLRPMGLADLLDASFALYRRNFALFAGISAVLGVPQAVIVAVLAALSTGATTTTLGGNGHAYSLNAGSGGGGLIGFIFGTLIEGALAFAIARRYLGERVTLEGAYIGVGTRGFLRLFGAVLLGLLAGLVVIFIPLIIILVGAFAGIPALAGVGVVLIVAAGVVDVVLLVHWFFAPQAVVIEGLGATAALRRSWDLVRGTAWRVFGIGLVVSLIVSILSGIIAGVFTAVLLLGGNDRGTVFLASLVASLVTLLIRPFQRTAFTLLYFDLRIRKEGFDLEQMVRNMDVSGAP
jgi:hypothetical protein